MSSMIQAPLIIRGEIIEGGIEFSGRRGEAKFVAPDVRRHLDKLPLSPPSAMMALHDISFDEILDYLERLGQRMELDKNPHLQAAFALSREASGLSDSILEAQYRGLPHLFRREVVREAAENSVGLAYLEGWVPQPSAPGSPTQTRVRAFGARTAHIIAGNVPNIGVMTIIRNAITRSDAIIKTPSNDPLTATAVARTMIEMEPDHPLTRHVTVAYWKGGDEAVESVLYDPRNIEKIMAWGGFASIKHITKYLQPGLDLITLDPKHSATIIGREAFENEAHLESVATRLALDVGRMNQEACVNARVVYVESGTDEAGLAKATHLGQLTFDALQALPPGVSTPHKDFDRTLRQEIEGLRFASNEYNVIGGRGSEGAVIVSKSDAPVDFASLLSGRVANIVPVDDVETAVRYTNAYTQTIGVFPDSLKTKLRDRLAYQGAQRIVSLGTAVPLVVRSGPHDGIELVRRMCKWLTDETTEEADIVKVASA